MKTETERKGKERKMCACVAVEKKYKKKRGTKGGTRKGMIWNSRSSLYRKVIYNETQP